jgi:ankyrin repeat protein
MKSEFYKDLLSYYELDQDELLEASQEISYAGDWFISSANIAGELNESNVNETHDGKSMLSLVLGIMQSLGRPGGDRKSPEPGWNYWRGVLVDLLAAGANAAGHDFGFFNSDDLRYWSLLNAATGNRADIANALLDRDSDVNEYFENISPYVSAARKTTPLNLAAEYDSLDVGQVILDRRGNVNLKDSQGNSPLHNATGSLRGQIYQNTRNLSNYGKFAKLLIDRHALVDASNDRQETPLHNVARMCKHVYSSNIDPVDIVRILINRGANVNATTETGATPLHYAVQDVDTLNVSKPDSMVLSVLIDNGARVAAADDQGRMPLHIACESGWIEAVNGLLDSDADPNAESSGLFKTPLQIAIDGNRNPNIQIAKILLSRGANPIGVDLSGIG